jgi:hypothetical protein
MEGNPAEFEAIGNRLGFRIVEETPQVLRLRWQGPRFPAFLCLGIALLLLFVSVPIGEAIRLSGLQSRAASLWYFPLMNLVLFPIALYLLSLKRTVVFDSAAQRITLTKRSLFKKIELIASYAEVQEIRLGMDQVYSGFAVAGSSAAQKFPVPSLRLTFRDGQTVLLDRGSRRRLEELGKRAGDLLKKPLGIASTS